MDPEQSAKAGFEFGNEAGERLHRLLHGQLPTPQSYMAFYGASGGTIIGNALSEVVRNAGKEIAAQWLGEVLGIIQITARRAGADIILAGGVSLKSMAQAPAAAALQQPEPASDPELSRNICACEIVSGRCWSCEQEIGRSVDRFSSLLKGLVVDASSSAQKEICKVCKVKLIDDLLAAAIRKHAPGFGDRLPAAIEIFLAVVLPQLKAASPEVAWVKTMEAVSEQAAQVSRST